MMLMGWRASLLGSIVVSEIGFTSVFGFDKKTCTHCPTEGAYEEFLLPESTDPGPHTEVHAMWSTHIEVVSMEDTYGGWEPPSFAKKLADEVITGWKRFRDKIGPGLPQGHHLRNFLTQSHAGALNDGFFHFQKRLFEAEGDFDKAMDMSAELPAAPPPEANSSWPQMNALPEYKKLRKMVEMLSRRYLTRSGMHPTMAANLNYSLFNWAAVNGPGEFHGPHTHVGEYHVGVFYAQAGPSAGKLRFGDPRGHSPPFGKTFFYTPKAGDLVIFPSWLSHMATVTSPMAKTTKDGKKIEDDPMRVIFSFNIGPIQGPLPCHLWWSDPTSDMRFKRRSKIDIQAIQAAVDADEMHTSEDGKKTKKKKGKQDY